MPNNIGRRRARITSRVRGGGAGSRLYRAVTPASLRGFTIRTNILLGIMAAEFAVYVVVLTALAKTQLRNQNRIPQIQTGLLYNGCSYVSAACRNM